MNRKITLTLALCLFLMVLATVAMAQPLPPAPTDGAPLDGVTSLLIVSGIAYGGMKLKRNKG
jgi:hypothetical protein